MEPLWAAPDFPIEPLRPAKPSLRQERTLRCTMDLLVLIGAVIGLYVVVALFIYGTRFGRQDDDATSRRHRRPSRETPRKNWRQYWL